MGETAWLDGFFVGTGGEGRGIGVYWMAWRMIWKQ